jgi:hypothetical protein
MANRFGISPQDEEAIRTRDRACVYCHKTMRTAQEVKSGMGEVGDQASIEHLNFCRPFYIKDGLRPEDIVICCRSCNSSRGQRRLWDWFQSEYCVKHNINLKTVAHPVCKYLLEMPDELKDFVTACQWTFAKTYADTWPHEYIVRERADLHLFNSLAYHIESRGYVASFYETQQIYWDHSGQTYWHMENIINRCPKSETYERKKRERRLPT